jgi:hypothetical protein
MTLLHKEQQPDVSGAEDQRGFAPYRALAANLDTAAKHRVVAGKALEAAEYEQATRSNLLVKHYMHRADKARYKTIRHRKQCAFIHADTRDHAMPLIVSTVHEN